MSDNGRIQVTFEGQPPYDAEELRQIASGALNRAHRSGFAVVHTKKLPRWVSDQRLNLGFFNPKRKAKDE